MISQQNWSKPSVIRSLYSWKGLMLVADISTTWPAVIIMPANKTVLVCLCYVSGPWNMLNLQAHLWWILHFPPYLQFICDVVHIRKDAFLLLGKQYYTLNLSIKSYVVKQTYSVLLPRVVILNKISQIYFEPWALTSGAITRINKGPKCRGGEGCTRGYHMGGRFRKENSRPLYSISAS